MENCRRVWWRNEGGERILLIQFPPFLPTAQHLPFLHSSLGFGTSSLLLQDDLFCSGLPQSFFLDRCKPEGERNFSLQPDLLLSGTA